MAQPTWKSIMCCAVASWALFSCASLARADEAADGWRPLPVGLVVEPGVWRTKVQMVFDPKSRTIDRKLYTTWDALPSRNLDFLWIPKTLAGDQRGRISGQGRLTWRLKDRPTYDRSAIYFEYQGNMKDGRPDGAGLYLDRDGVSYEGAWKDGMVEGQGRLRLADGAEYVGSFRAGKANGRGTFVDVDGEVYEGGFRDGLRDGIATTILPNHLSYRSRWSMGWEVPLSRTLRLAQLGGRAGAPAQDVRVGVIVARKPADSPKLGYTSTNAANGLEVRPDSKRLMALWKGDAAIQLTSAEENEGELGGFGVFALSPETLLPLQMTLEVQNRARGPIQVVGTFLDVEASATDLQPAVQLSVGSDGECDGRVRRDYSPTFELQNFGWGAVENPKLRFAFTRQGAAARPALDLRKDLKPFQSSEVVDLEPELKARGVDIASLRQRVGTERRDMKRFKCAAEERSTCLAALGASGVFGQLANATSVDDINILLGVTGILDYDWRNSAGAVVSRSSPFTARLLLGRFETTAECGEGGEPEAPSRKPFELELDRKHYRLPLAFERAVPGGRTARYVLTLHAAKSSHHKFKIVLQLADGREVASRPIALTYFVPNRKPGS